MATVISAPTADARTILTLSLKGTFTTSIPGAPVLSLCPRLPTVKLGRREVVPKHNSAPRLSPASVTPPAETKRMEGGSDFPNRVARSGQRATLVPQPRDGL
jgi:hypothetical protein